MDDQVALLSALPWPLLHGRTGTARGQGLRRVDHRLANRVRACPCGETIMWADRLEGSGRAGLVHGVAPGAFVLCPNCKRRMRIG